MGASPKTHKYEIFPECDAMRVIGRLMQIAGLTLPPLSMLLQLSDAIKASQMLVMLVGAVCLFGVGRILEGYGRR